MNRKQYADHLTGFERRLLDGLLTAAADGRRPARRRLLATPLAAASVAVALIVVTGVSVLLDARHVEQVPGETSMPTFTPTVTSTAPAGRFSYVRAIKGADFLSMDAGHEVSVEVRSEQEVWLGTEREPQRTLRVRLDRHVATSCHTKYRPELCTDWLGKHKNVQLVTELVDRTLTCDLLNLAGLEEHGVPVQVSVLLPVVPSVPTLVLEALPTAPPQLDDEMTKLSHDVATRNNSGKVLEQDLDLYKLPLLTTLMSLSSVSTQTRLAAFELVKTSAYTRVSGTAVDRLGRPGVRVIQYHSAVHQEEFGVTELVVDPATGMLLSKELYMPPPPDTKRPREPVLVRDFILYLDAGPVNSLEQTR